MKKLILFLLLALTLSFNAEAETVDWFQELGATSEVTHLILNGNIRNIHNVLNGGLDNDNSKESFFFVERLGALPLAGTEGRVVYLTTGDTLNFDDGTQWWESPNYTGTAIAGDILYFNGTNWTRLAAGTAGEILITGTSPSWSGLGDNEFSGVLTTNDGGTGLDNSAAAQGGILYFSATGVISVLPVGTSGYHLQTQGASANPQWAKELGGSNVVFCWSGNESYSANTYGMNVSSTQSIDLDGTDSAGYINFATDDTTYRTFLNFKFKKTASIDTVTIHARLWSVNAAAGTEAFLNVDIGGQNNFVKSVESTTPSWVTSSDIDVSSLTDGTVYDGVVQLKAENAGTDVYCSAVTLIGS